MYGLLIVDDERLIRQGLKNVIPWNEMGFNVVGEANCGQAALELARSRHPDVVLTDIRMLDMTGLELISSLKAEFPSLRSVIISGYSDFDYAVKALKLRVEDYILKPIEPRQIKRVFIQLKSKLDAEAKQKMYQRNIRYVYTEFDMIRHLYDDLNFEDTRPQKSSIENLTMLSKSLMEHLETGDDTGEIIEKILSEVNRNQMNPAGAYLYVLHELSRYFQIFDWQPSEVLQSDSEVQHPVLTDFEGIIREGDSEIPSEQMDRIFLENMDTLKKHILNRGGSGAEIIVDRAKRLIEEQYDDPSLSLSRIAQKLNISYGYLSMIFSRITGTGFSVYLMEIRMEKARQFLRRRTLKIYEVASLTGFSNVHYFSDSFKKHYGLSPAEYTRSIGRRSDDA